VRLAPVLSCELENNGALLFFDKVSSYDLCFNYIQMDLIYLNFNFGLLSQVVVTYCS
jgi:hypothetical protein